MYNKIISFKILQKRTNYILLLYFNKKMVDSQKIVNKNKNHKTLY